MASLKQKTVSGVFWTGIAKLGMQVMIVAVMFILARLLSEGDFGIVAMAGIITVAIGMVNDRGLGTAIIQKKTINESQLSTVYWGGLVFGLLLFILGVIAAFPLAVFFNEPMIVSVFIVLSSGFFFGAFGIVQKSLLTREMAFKKLAMIEIISVIASGIFAIILALLNFGVWSLVVLALFRDFIMVILVWFATPWRPKFHFSWQEFKEMLSFSASVLGNDVALYLVTNADVSVIGKVLGKVLLGYYSLALNLVKMPTTRLSAIVARVVFPVFSGLQDQPEKLKKSFLRSITFISLLTFPALAGLAVFAGEFIHVFLGEKWLPMTWPLIILTPMAMLKSIGSLKGSVLMACGRPDIELKWNVIYLAPLVGAVWLGSRWGLIGASAAFTIVYLVSFPIIQNITNKQLNASMLEFGKSIHVSTLATFIMVICGLLVKLLLVYYFKASNLIVLIAGIIISILVYYLALQLLHKDLFVELLSLLKVKPNKKNKIKLSEAAINS